MKKNLSQGSRSPGRGLKPGPSDYEVGVLTTRSRCSAVCVYVCVDNYNVVILEI
jgi:hypothetical protein